MINRRLDRRTFLRGAAGITIALPMLEAMMPLRRALGAVAGAQDPKRFVSIYIPDGTALFYNNGNNWWGFPTTGTMDKNQLPVVFQPFAANVQDFQVIKGIHSRVAANSWAKSPNSQHGSAIATYLTAEEWANNQTKECTMKGISFDQLIQQKTGKKSLVFAITPDVNINDLNRTSTFNYCGRLSYANGTGVDPILNPVYMYNQLFSNLAGSPGSGGTGAPQTPSSILMQNKSILDYVRGDVSTLKGRLGKGDNLKLDHYLTSLRDLENSLLGMLGMGPGNPPAPAQCMKPTAPNNSLNNDNQDDHGDQLYPKLLAFADLIAMAFACDLSRASTIQPEPETSQRYIQSYPKNLNYGGADMNRQSHDTAHYGDDASINYLITRDRIYAGFAITLAEKLKGYTDPSGSSLLDNTAILAGLGLADGNHPTDGDALYASLPTMLVGGKNFLKPGRYIDVGQKEVGDLLYTIGAGMGLGITDFKGHNSKIDI